MTFDIELPSSGFVTSSWVKNRYSISNSTLYSWISQDLLPRPYRIGLRAVRFKVEEIRDFEAAFQDKGGQLCLDK